MSEEIDAEQLVANIEQYGDANGPPQSETEAANELNSHSAEMSEEQAAPQPQRYKYKVDGREVEEDLETVLKRASMGYHYAQKMAEFNKMKSEWEPRIKSVEELESKWKPYDEISAELRQLSSWRS